jgi:hypothetical protein
MNTKLLRRAFWGGLRHHYEDCSECSGTGAYDDEEECDRCEGEGKLFWGSFYGGRDGGCDFCTHGGDGDIIVASLYEGDPGHEYVCLRCYLKHHREACGCDLWAAVEACVRWPEPQKATGT